MLALVEKAKKGDRSAFVELIDHIKIKAYKTAYMQLGNKEDAKDAVQDTILKVYERISTLRQNEFFQTWFIRILLNECHDIQRSRSKIISLIQKQERNQDITTPDPSRSVEMKELIGGLGEIHRLVIDLRYNHSFEDKSLCVNKKMCIFNHHKFDKNHYHG